MTLLGRDDVKPEFAIVHTEGNLLLNLKAILSFC